jgi:hypothetical protein
MWLLIALFFFVLGIAVKDEQQLIISALFVIAHNIEYLAIQVKNLKK